MKDFLLLAESRRSIRKFEQSAVDIDIVLDMIKAATYAPSAGDVQPWEFTVVTDKDVITKIVGCCPQQDWLINAPVLVIVTAKMTKMEAYFGEKAGQWCDASCAAAVQNMLLAAHARGAGACWVTSFTEDSLRETLGIPSDIIIEAVVAVGNTTEVPRDKTTMPLDQITYFNKYGSKDMDTDMIKRDYGAYFRKKKKEMGQQMEAKSAAEEMQASFKERVDSLKERLTRKR